MKRYEVNSTETGRVELWHDNPGDHIPCDHWEHGRFYEYDALSFLQLYLPHPKINKKGIILDIGANVGNHTVFWAAQGHTVVPFEPNPRANTLLRRNIESNNLSTRVLLEISHYGVSDQRSRIDVVDDMKQNLGGAHIVFSKDDSKSDKIECVPLDSLKFGKRVDFVKIDVEGHEENVLRGAKKTIADNRPLIYCEATNETRKTVEKILKGLSYDIEARHRTYTGVYNILAIPQA
jgi:FkbM family methyltransferase